MNKQFLVPILTVLLIAFTACSYSTEWVKIERKFFCLEMPPYTDVMENISVQKAELEWGSYFKNFYLVIKKHPLQNLEELAQRTKNKLLANDNFHKPRETELRKFTVNNLPAVEWIIRGGVGREALREEITYYHYFIGGKSRIYELTLWNWTARDAEFKPDIDKIINSFKASEEGC